VHQRRWLVEAGAAEEALTLRSEDMSTEQEAKNADFPEQKVVKRLIEINKKMFDATIDVLSKQNTTLHERCVQLLSEIKVLTEERLALIAENAALLEKLAAK
jgi:hypothetical protein